MPHDILEFSFVLVLFLGYSILWAAKRRMQKRQSEVDPEVHRTASTPVQGYFSFLLRVFVVLVVANVALHAFAPSDWGALRRLALIDARVTDFMGFGLGLSGLVVCLVAQVTMGNSWRVGIDSERKTELVTDGIFRLCRNPTYVGLFAMNGGLWLIWPTAAVAAYFLFFFVIMEVQVRAEEEYLLKTHGHEYEEYLRRSARYFPGIY